MPQKILVLVAEAISGEALESALGPHVRDAEVLVVAPATTTRFRWLTGDTDDAIQRAEAVQEETVERLDEEGVDAAGGTGDSDPLLAVQDALQTYPADQIVLFTHGGGERNWLEEGIVDQARERFDAPVKHMTVE